MKKVVTMEKAAETKHCIRYMEQAAVPVTRGLYIEKSSLPEGEEAPKTIQVTIEG